MDGVEAVWIMCAVVFDSNEVTISVYGKADDTL